LTGVSRELPFVEFIVKISVREDRATADFCRRRGQESNRTAARKVRGRELAT
jgi:hypothetical protein